MPEIPQNSLRAMLVVLALLITATTARLIIKAKNPEKDFTELRQRIQSWWIMVFLIFFALVLSRGLATIFFAFLSFLALKEFLSIVPTRQSDRRVIFWAYLSIPLQYYFIYIDWQAMFTVFIPVFVFLFLPIRMVLIGETKGFIKSIGMLHWAIMLTVYFISHIAHLLTLPNLNPDAGNIGLVLFLLFMTQFNDICQYCWGKMLGRYKIIPKVSPNKTWAGFLGGVSTITLCAGFAAPYLTPMSMAHGFLAGLLVGCGGFFGDVVVSSVKRDLQIKDSGAMIPGHGGVLDRMDSLLFTAPIFYHYVHYLYY